MHVNRHIKRHFREKTDRVIQPWDVDITSQLDLQYAQAIFVWYVYQLSQILHCLVYHKIARAQIMHLAVIKIVVLQLVFGKWGYERPSLNIHKPFLYNSELSPYKQCSRGLILTEMDNSCQNHHPPNAYICHVENCFDQWIRWMWSENVIHMYSNDRNYGVILIRSNKKVTHSN